MTGRDVPAGWYDDGHGFQRWFDGTVWTETVVPGGSSRPATARSDSSPRPAESAPQLVPPPPYVPPEPDPAASVAEPTDASIDVAAGTSRGG